MANWIQCWHYMILVSILQDGNSLKGLIAGLWHWKVKNGTGRRMWQAWARLKMKERLWQDQWNKLEHKQELWEQGQEDGEHMEIWQFSIGITWGWVSFFVYLAMSCWRYLQESGSWHHWATQGYIFSAGRGRFGVWTLKGCKEVDSWIEISEWMEMWQTNNT